MKTHQHSFFALHTTSVNSCPLQVCAKSHHHGSTCHYHVGHFYMCTQDWEQEHQQPLGWHPQDRQWCNALACTANSLACWYATCPARWCIQQISHFLHLLSPTANSMPRHIGKQHAQVLKIEMQLTATTCNTHSIHKCNYQRQQPMGQGRSCPNMWTQHQLKRQLTWVWGIHARTSTFSLREHFG